MNTRIMLGYYGKISNQFNLSQVKKRKIREFKDVLSHGNGSPTEFKRISPEELKKLKNGFVAKLQKSIAKRLKSEYSCS